MLRKRAKVRRLSEADIRRELAVFEKKYGMTTEEFRRKYFGGELDGTPDFVHWMGLGDMLDVALGKRLRRASA